MKEGDYIVGINEEDVKWSPHDEVVALIKASANSLKLRVVTPMDGKPKVSGEAGFQAKKLLHSVQGDKSTRDTDYVDIKMRVASSKQAWESPCEG